jgi:tetratricopeptide (TPR) repeat protein
MHFSNRADRHIYFARLIRQTISMDGEFDLAIAAFNRGRYFEAAERFEHALGDPASEVREMAGALGRVAAALHLRFERGGRQAAVNLFSQALITLEDFRPASAGIDVERLCVELTAMADEIRASPREEREGLRYRARLFVERRRAPKINRTGPTGSARG